MCKLWTLYCEKGRHCTFCIHIGTKSSTVTFFSSWHKYWKCQHCATCRWESSLDGKNPCFHYERKLLVSTYVVCGRSSVMQCFTESGKAKFVLKLARTPYSRIWYRSWHFEFWILQNTPPPPQWNLGRSWLFVGVCGD